MQSYGIVTDAELERAARLMRNHPDTRILNARVVPRWIENGRRFWYKRETKSGHDFLMVDASTGARELAFDHGAAAASLANLTGVAVRPSGLPVIAVDTDTLDAEVEGKHYRCSRSEWVWSPLAEFNAAEIVSPDGTWALFRRDENLWVRDLGNGAERALTPDGEPQFGYGMPSDRFDQNKLVRKRCGVELAPVQTWWSPDSQRIVTARLDQRHLAPYHYLENAPRDGSFRPKLHDIRLPLMGEAPGRLDWWVIDVRSGNRRPIDFPTDRMIAANNGIDDLKIAWADVGSTLLAISAMTDFVGAEAFAVDLDTGKVRTILQDRSSSGHPLVAGGYGRPIARFVRGGTELIWWSERDGWGHLYRYRVEDGRLLARLTQGDWLVRDIVGVDEENARLWFTGMGREPGNPYHRHLYRVNLDDGSDLKLMSPEPGDHMIVDPTGSALVFDGAGPTDVLAPDFQNYVYDVSSIAEPTRTILRRSSEGALIATVEQADVTGLLAGGYRPPEEVATRAADGTSMLHGLVFRPSDYDPSRSYPVIDVEYGNPAVAITPRTFRHATTFAGTAATPAALAELGFVVVVVDARGTPNRGRAFSHAGPGYLATMGLEDHLPFIKAVALGDAGLDMTRIGIAGQSFGGYTVLRALIEFPDVFKAGVAGAPQTGYHNMAAEAVLTTSEGPPVYANGSSRRATPTEIPKNFAALDTASQLNRIMAPLLIVAGEQDENVYPGTIVQFIDRAIRENRNVDLIWVPNGGHEALFTPYALRRSLEFLTRHLQRRLLPDRLPELPDPERR